MQCWFKADVVAVVAVADVPTTVRVAVRAAVHAVAPVVAVVRAVVFSLASSLALSDTRKMEESLYRQASWQGLFNV